MTSAEIESLVSRFIAKELPKAEWTHEAHIAAGIWHLWQHSREDAMYLMRVRIKAHNDAVGTPNSDTDGYHETITRFWVAMIYQQIKQGHFDSKHHALESIMASPVSASTYPFEFYSKELLESVKARHEWMAPDLNQPSWLIWDSAE